MSGLHVDFFNVRIVLGGPKRSEAEARARLARVLYEGFAEGYEEKGWEGLIECLYLADSGFAEREATKIAYDTNPKTGLPYVQYQTKGNRITIGVVALDVTYQNSGGKPTKWWARIRNGKQTIEPGDLY
jgi:hypothetical protein